MALFSFGDYPQIGFAFPFANLSFEAWAGTTYPDEWDLIGSGTNATFAKYTPGFDLTRAIALGETSTPVKANMLEQRISLPDYIENGQKSRIGACLYSDLEGSYGIAKCVVRLGQGATSAVADGVDWSYNNSWTVVDDDSYADINTANTELFIRIYTDLYGSETNVLGLFDCLKAEYGRTALERYYTFTRFPELSGLDIRPMTFRKDERTGRGTLRSYDGTGGAVKWKITMPFENVPESFVEALNDFWRGNRGLDDGISRPLCLTHNLMDLDSTHTGADETYLGRPPWIICNITNKDFPFKHTGSWLGAGMYSGTLTFEEI